MSAKLYLDGCVSNEEILVSLDSAAVLFVLRYCETSHVPLTFIDCGSSHDRVSLSINELMHIPYEAGTTENVPGVVLCCALPVQYSGGDFVRSGLCCVLRFIIMEACTLRPEQRYEDILGFRAGCLRACSEVSSWTKLCEVQVPQAVRALLQISNNLPCLDVPLEIIKLDLHLDKDAVVHNKNKHKLNILKDLKDKCQTKRQSTHHTSSSDISCKNLIQLLIEDIQLPHCSVAYTIAKDFTVDCTDCLKNLSIKTSDRGCEKLHCGKINLAQSSERGNKRQCICTCDCVMSNTEVNIQQINHASAISMSNGINQCCVSTGTNKSEIGSNQQLLVSSDDGSKDEMLTPSDGQSDRENVELVEAFINRLTKEDILLTHRYMEGTELTLSDIILFVFIYHFMHSIRDYLSQLPSLCPRLCAWFKHMAGLRHIHKASHHLDTRSVIDALHSSLPCSAVGQLGVPVYVQDDEDFQRIVRTKHRAIQPDIIHALAMIQKSDIFAEISQHPCTGAIQLDWESMPQAVHPIEGNLPEKRAKRKYEQIESVVSAIIDIAKPDDVIVDFCSGGGHVGIVVAYLLPQCQVYLVENKEESLQYARSRIKSLTLNNVTVFQCNLEYFHGHFDIGCCLHACGVASDMVQQTCLDNHAAFVICPCCYGSVQDTHLITYPRSLRFKDAGLLLNDCLTLAHAADMTEVGIVKENTGKQCMNLIDWDRALLAREHGYTVTLSSLQPPTCSPKNNLLVGTLGTS